VNFRLVFTNLIPAEGVLGSFRRTAKLSENEGAAMEYGAFFSRHQWLISSLLTRLKLEFEIRK